MNSLRYELGKTKGAEIETPSALQGIGTSWSRMHSYFNETDHLARFPSQHRSQAALLMRNAEKQQANHRYRLLLRSHDFLLTIQQYIHPTRIELELVEGSWPDYSNKCWPREPYNRASPVYRGTTRTERLLCCQETNTLLEADCSTIVLQTHAGRLVTPSSSTTKILEGTTLQEYRRRKNILAKTISPEELIDSPQIFILNAVLGVQPVDAIRTGMRSIWNRLPQP